jgi:hypothetical protein
VFIQIISGQCTDEQACRALGERWLKDLAPGATGWLGGTYGFTDDGRFVGVVRFESREAAAANAARPEQDAWWAEMARLFEGDVEFHESDDVTLMMGGGSDDAGFVQVIRGTVDDPDALRSMMLDTHLLHEMRPEILGGTLVIEEDGTFTETVAFADEASARKGEQQEMPEQVRRTLESAMHDVRYLDLHQPWFASRTA